jgi:hypothetical protein
MTPDCKSCRHCTTERHAILASNEDYCQSAQLRAATQHKLMCRLERSASTENDWWRVNYAMRRCGPEGLNYEAKA